MWRLYGRYVSSVRERSVFMMDTKSVMRTIMEDAEAQARGPKMKKNGRTPLWKKLVSHYLVADAARGEVNRWEGIRGCAAPLTTGSYQRGTQRKRRPSNSIWQTKLQVVEKKNIQCAWSMAQSIISSHLCRDRIDSVSFVLNGRHLQGYEPEGGTKCQTWRIKSGHCFWVKLRSDISACPRYLLDLIIAN